MNPIIIVAIIGAIGAIGAALITYQQGRERNKLELEKLNRKWEDKFKPMKIPTGERKNTVLLAGQGRVGKTQLISSLIDSEPGNTRVTNDFRIISYRREFEDKFITYYFTDYRGQNFGQLVNSFIKEQLTADTIIRYGDINSLLLMVDIVPDEGDKSLPNKKYEDIDSGRIKSHIKLWNRFTLDALFALLERDSLQYVCLLINKIDKLEKGFNKGVRNRLIKKFQPLTKDLKRRAEGSTAKFDIIFCSAYKGTNVRGVEGLEPKLSRFSVPRRENT